MADQDFNIKVVTTADTTGLKQTAAEMEAVKEKSTSVTSGFGSTAVGIGTITTLLFGAINRWKAFNDELDLAVEKMDKAQEKMRELGDSIIDMQDKAISAARIGVEPLYQSFIRLQQEIIRLKTEQNLLDLPRQGDEWKKLAHDLTIVESQLKGVTSELNKQKKASEDATASAEKLAEANERAASSFLKGAVETAQPQVQAVLKNEEAARQAREAGAEKDAELYQKTADQLKSSMSQAQREEYEGLTRPTRLGPKAGPGESQAALDEIARNKINFERGLKGEAPLPAQPQGNDALSQAIQQAFDRSMEKYWGP